jgi:hypothetical protein
MGRFYVGRRSRPARIRSRHQEVLFRSRRDYAHHLLHHHLLLLLLFFVDGECVPLQGLRIEAWTTR